MKTELHQNVRDFLAKPIPHHIGGQARLTATGKVTNPSDGSTLAEVSLGGAADVDLAVAAATKTFPAWVALRPNERAALLHRFADTLEKHAAEIAQLESLDVGKAIAAAEGFDVPFGIQCLRYFADLSTQAHYSIPLAIKNMEARTWRVPYGVCGFIFPWNFPFTLLCWGIAPALAAGNTVVVKPSEVTPLSSLFVAKLAAEGRWVVTILRTEQYRGLESFTEVGPFLPLARDRHSSSTQPHGRRITCLPASTILFRKIARSRSVM